MAPPRGLDGGGLLAVLAAVATIAPRVRAFHRGFHGHGSHGFAGLVHNPERAKERAALATEWALRAVDGTEEQMKQARVITDRLVDELVPLAARYHDQRQAMARELEKPELDREALERLRREGMTLAEEASKATVDAVADLAEVLRPDQRVELLKLLHRFHGPEPASIG